MSLNKKQLYENIMGVISKELKRTLNEGKWLPREEWLKLQAAAREERKKHTCAFNDYQDVTQDMVDYFWNKERYKDNLIDIADIRPEFRSAYNTAKKNVAMLDYAMSPTYTVHFDKDANLHIMINHGASWSNQNHLHHYAGKCRQYFKLESSAWSAIDDNKWELLYDGYNKL